MSKILKLIDSLMEAITGTTWDGGNGDNYLWDYVDVMRTRRKMRVALGHYEPAWDDLSRAQQDVLLQAWHDLNARACDRGAAELGKAFGFDPKNFVRPRRR